MIRTKLLLGLLVAAAISLDARPSLHAQGRPLPEGLEVMGNFSSTVPLLPGEQWTLQDGTVLTGQVMSGNGNADTLYVVDPVSRQRMSILLEHFSDEDRRKIEEAWFVPAYLDAVCLPKSQSRVLLADGTSSWMSLFREDETYAYGEATLRSVRVKKGLLDAQSLADCRKEIAEKTGNGRYQTVMVKKGFTAFNATLVEESTSEFILETGNDTILPKGSFIRLPKYCVSQFFQAALRHYRSEANEEMPPLKELPVLCRTESSFFCVFEGEPKQGTIEGIGPTGNKLPIRLDLLLLQDRINLHRLIEGEPVPFEHWSNPGPLRDLAQKHHDDHGPYQRFWCLRDAPRSFSGTIQNVYGERFVVPVRRDKVLISASRLEPIDRAFADIAYKIWQREPFTEEEAKKSAVLRMGGYGQLTELTHIEGENPWFEGVQFGTVASKRRRPYVASYSELRDAHELIQELSIELPHKDDLAPLMNDVASANSTPATGGTPSGGKSSVSQASPKAELVDRRMTQTFLGEKEWRLADGAALFGYADLRAWPKFIRFSDPERRGKFPQSLTVAIKDLALEDQTKLKEAYMGKSEYAAYYLSPPFALTIEKWAGRPPSNVHSLKAWVGMDPEWLYSLDPKKPELYRLATSAVADDELTRLRSKYAAAMKSGVLLLPQNSQYLLRGKIVQTGTDELLAEISESEGTCSVPMGTLVRIPKSTVGAAWFELLSHAAKHDSARLTKTISQEKQMQAATLRAGRSGFFACFPARAEDLQRGILGAPGEPLRRVGWDELNCTDLLEHLGDYYRAEGASDAEAIQRAASVVADRSERRVHWNVFGGRIFGYKPMARFGDYVLFSDRSKSFCLHAKHLPDADRMVTAIIAQRKTLDWCTGDFPWEGAFAYRLIEDGTSMKHVTVMEGENQTVEAVLRGASLPVFQGVRRSSIRTISLASWQALQDDRASLADFKKLADAEDWSGMRKRITDVQSDDPALADMVDVPPVQKPAQWHSSLYCTLLGRRGEDLVFHCDRDGISLTYLVPEKNLKKDKVEQAKILLERLPTDDWDKLLTKDPETWQFFRVLGNREPAVVDRIDESTIHFRTHSGGWFGIPHFRDEKRLAEYADLIEQGRKRRVETAGLLQEWTLKQTPEPLLANFIGYVQDHVVIQDVNETVSLFAIYNLDRSSKDKFAEMLNELEPWSEAKAEELPWTLCGKEKIFAPGTFERFNNVGDALLRVEGRRDYLRIRSRDLAPVELAALKALEYRNKHGLKDDRAIDLVLNRPVEPSAVIDELPSLRPEILESLASAQAWRHDTWGSKPLALKDSDVILAANQTASYGVIERDGKSFLADLTTGGVSPMSDATFSNRSYGPWMGSGKKVCWATRNEIFQSDGSTVTSRFQGGGDFLDIQLSLDQSRVLVCLPKLKVVSLSLDKDEQEVLFERKPQRVPAREVDSDPVLLRSSHSGQGFFLKSGSNVLVQAAAIPGEAKQSFTFGETRPVEEVYVGRSFFAIKKDDQNGFDAGTIVPPRSIFRHQSPFRPTWSGIVDVEQGEFLVSIGRPAHSGFQDADFNFVVYQQPKGSTYRIAYQYLEGEFDEQSLVLDNGRRIIHRKAGQYVVSERPALVERLSYQVEQYVENFVDELDIGQLEALVRHLEGPAYWEAGSYPGSYASDAVALACQAVTEFKQHLGGDSLHRKEMLCRHLIEKFPDSHVAKVMAANWHRNAAWEARGTGYAGTVTAFGRKVFEREMGLARELQDELLSGDNPLATAFQLYFEIEMAGDTSLADAQSAAQELLDSKHADNPRIHNQVALMLLPRWHGRPGMTENYLLNVANALGGERGDMVYALSLAELGSMAGRSQSSIIMELDVDWERFYRGTKAYAERNDSPKLLDIAILMLGTTGKPDLAADLVALRASRRLLLGPTAYRNLEAYIGLVDQLP